MPLICNKLAECSLRSRLDGRDVLYCNHYKAHEESCSCLTVVCPKYEGALCVPVEEEEC